MMFPGSSASEHKCRNHEGEESLVSFLCEHDVIVIPVGKGLASHPGRFEKSEKIAIVSHVQLKIYGNVHINITAHGGNMELSGIPRMSGN